MNTTCAICLLPIHEVDRRNMRTVRTKTGDVHSYCRAMSLGVVPECPLAANLDPKPCSEECIQARSCASPEVCGCACDNVFCQIGQSVRVLRARGAVSWIGYHPDVPQPPEAGIPLATVITVKGIFVGDWDPEAYARSKRPNQV